METVLVVLAWLAEGAVKHLGGELMKSILGSPDLKNIDAIVRAAINEINIATRQSIDENEIRKLVAAMDSVLRNLRDYSELTTQQDQFKNDFLLKDAILKTNDAASQCASLRVPAILCYTNAVSLNLLARSAYYKLHETESAQKLIRNMVEDSTQFIASIIPPFMDSLAPSNRLSIPNPHCECESYPDDRQGPPITCWVLVDGKPVNIIKGIGPLDDGEYDARVAQVSQDLENFRNDVSRRIELPVQEAVQAWKNAYTLAFTLHLAQSDEGKFKPK